MPTIQQAIENFRASRLAVYAADEDEIIRNANSAAETAQDHVGRWLYELIQNSDDARADKILVKVTGNAVYVADNGNGLTPETIKSLSGTHLSVKPAGCIGRKGLGFKSVYTISQSPHIFSGDDGLVFCPKKALEWIRENKLAESKIPHQWLPFWVYRSAVAASDPVLAGIEMGTVIKLPNVGSENVRQAVESLTDLPAYALLSFPHIKELRVDAGDEFFSIVVEPSQQGKPNWKISDERSAQKQLWFSNRKVVPTPPDILSGLDESDRERVRNVSLLVAAPTNEQGEVAPIATPVFLHVYYPTEEPSPIPVLLHADFVVKSDRTKIISTDTNAFNAWMVEQLAEHIVECVNDWYAPAAPAANLRLLFPRLNSEPDATTNKLWSLIEQRAKTVLRLPNQQGDRILEFSEACIVATSIDPELARQIFDQGGYAPRLVHKSIEVDSTAKQVAIKLGCNKLSDQDLFDCISNATPELKSNRAWLWKCWNWVADWAATKRRQDYLRQYLASLKPLPIVPIADAVVSPQSLNGQIVTWRDDQFVANTPDWMPLRFVGDWFRDAIAQLAAEHPIRALLAEIQITKPSDGILLEALATGIKVFWQNRQGDPARFIKFLAAGDFHERFNITASSVLPRCPIPVRIEGQEKKVLVQAQQAYFWSEWGETLLAELFEGVSDVAWAERPEINAEQYRAVLTWLGVCEHPRLVKDETADTAEENWRVRRLLPNYTEVREISAPLKLDGL
jgi:hypothetical protein